MKHTHRTILRRGITLLSLVACLFSEFTASAVVPTGQAPQITAVKVYTPAGSVVEASTTDDSSRSVALEVTVEADAQGVEWFNLWFASPDGKSIAAFEGYSGSPTKTDPFTPMALQKQTFLINKHGLNYWNPFNKMPSYDLDAVGTWKLVGCELIGRNGQWRSYAVDTKQVYGSAPLPVGLTATSFKVTRYFSKQPVHSVVAPGASLRLSPSLASALPKATYQWYLNGVAIPKATALTFSKTGASVADAGLYQLEMTTGATKVRSDSVVVSIRTANVQATRTAINNQNGTSASSYATKALAESPAGSEALFASALSALYNVLADTKTSQSLKTLGVNLSLTFPLAPNALDNYTLPSSASSTTITSWVDNVVLPALQTATTRLSKITDPKFVTFISAADFAGWGVDTVGAAPMVVDYGDIQMAQVFLNGLSAIFNLTSSMNTGVVFSWLSSTADQGKLSIQTLLSKYPSLLAASATGPAKQHASFQALGKMADAYLNFSEFIYNRSRTATATRLVSGDRNLFPALNLFEQDPGVTNYYDLLYRDFATNVKTSITTGPVSFIADHSEERGVTSRYRVNLKALDSRPAGMRSSVPVFSKNQVLGTVPNPIFNGVLPDMTSKSLKSRLEAGRPKFNEAMNTQ